MISSIHPFVGNRSYCASPCLGQPVARTQRHQSHQHAKSLERADDALALSTDATPDNSLSVYQNASLQIRSHASIAQSEDGQLTAKSHTRLRFTYEFQATDGTKIQIRAKADLRYAAAIDDDSQAASIRLRQGTRIDPSTRRIV